MSIVLGVSSVAIGAPNDRNTLHYVFLLQTKLQDTGNRVFQPSPDCGLTLRLFCSLLADGHSVSGDLHDPLPRITAEQSKIKSEGTLKIPNIRRILLIKDDFIVIS